MASEPRRTVIVAFGLEHCRRGVEAHARMLFEKLKEETEVLLIKGSGQSAKDEIVLKVSNRDSSLNKILGHLRGSAIYWEQIFFMLRLGWHLIRNHRSYRVLYTQEYVHMVGVGILKRAMGWDFDLVYCEGFVTRNGTRIRYADALQEINVTNYDFIAPLAAEKDIPVKLIPHFFDIDYAVGAIDEKLVEEILAFRADKRLLLYVGPTELVEKNFIRVEEAIRDLSDDWRLLICGSTGQKRVNRLNSGAKKVAMSVYVSHAMMQRIYPLADLFVLPATEEPFGIAILEAMQHRLPVLLHSSDHSYRICNDSTQCADMHQPGIVSKYLREIQDFDVHKKNKGESNRAFFLNSFTWEHQKNDYLNLLKL